MRIKPDEITSILKSRIEGLDAGGASLTEVGTVLSVALALLADLSLAGAARAITPWTRRGA